MRRKVSGLVALGIMGLIGFGCASTILFLGFGYALGAGTLMLYATLKGVS